MAEQKKDALLEIGVEEIPARVVYKIFTYKELTNITQTICFEQRLKTDKISTFVTPRRLGVMLHQLPLKADDFVEEIIGPPERIAKNQNGGYTKAALGFAKTHNTEVSDLKIKATEKGNYLSITKCIIGDKTENVLKIIFPKIITTLVFNKPMVWENDRFSFVRPIRHIVALFGDKVIKFTIADVTANKYSSGLFPINMNKKIFIKSAGEYNKIMGNHWVIVDYRQRYDNLINQFKKIVKNKSFEINEDTQLVEETLCMVENPVAVIGKFDEKFLSIVNKDGQKTSFPENVLVNCLKTKQKCFTVFDKTNKKITNHFIAVANGINEKIKDTVSAGFSRVINARLNDTQFFYYNDTKTKLSEKTEKLKTLTFIERLGTMYDKVERLKNLTTWCIDNIPNEYFRKNRDKIIQAVTLCKNDLTTEMVFEYPELQGVMGKYYALTDGVDTEIANSIEQHYLPLTAHDSLTGISHIALIPGLVDKIDNIISNFAIGNIPTGSGDPHGLRRQSNGIIRIFDGNNLPWNISIDTIFRQAWDLLPPAATLGNNKNKIINDVIQFIRGRLESLLQTYQYRYDEINAVLNSNCTIIPLVFERIKAVKSVRDLPDYKSLFVGFKRAANIIRQAEAKNINVKSFVLKPELLTDPAEKMLYTKYILFKAETDKLITNLNYTEALNTFISLRTEIDNFFEKTMVMVEEENLRNNRLCLLYNIWIAFYQIADFSCIVTEK